MKKSTSLQPRLQHSSVHGSPRLPAQQGLALIIVLIALVIMLISAVALIRSFDVSSVQAGNLAFKRDLKNEAELGVLTAVNLLTSGALASDSVRAANQPSNNYLSSRLRSNERGIPLVLIDDSAFSAAGLRAADLVDRDMGVTVRYVIDRQCLAPGVAAASSCVMYSGTLDQSKDGRAPQINDEPRPVYRISVRATGPRDTQVFIQTTVVR